MSRVAFDGAEGGGTLSPSLTLVTSTGIVTAATDIKRSGNFGWRMQSGASANSLARYSIGSVSVLATVGYGSAWFYLPSSIGYPVNTTTIMFATTSGGGTAIGRIRLTSTGFLQLWGPAAQIGSDSPQVVPLDTWVQLQLGCSLNTGATDYAEARMNGASFASGSGLTHSEETAWSMYAGINADGPAGWEGRWDDLVFNSNGGSVHNSWPGNDRVVLLLPTSDNARAAGWTAGGGATTNLWEAVNNTPPVGVASPGTNTSQIGNGVSSTTQNYDANMQSYAAAGIGPSDTITALLAIAIGANNNITGTDTLRVAGVSNPVITQVSPSIDTLAATYPSGWNRLDTAIQENPTVTKATAPVMRVGKNIAATRRANVCFMGMMVSYVESPIDELGPRTSLQQNAVYRM